MSKLDPLVLFERIAGAIPKELHQHLLIAGSLAAAYHFRAQLEGRAVNTKDADVVVHPAGDVPSTRALAERLRSTGWQPTEHCRPQAHAMPLETLNAIRLYPPGDATYFVELLNIPATEQDEPKRWMPIELSDGWYGLPSFKYLSLIAINAEQASNGLRFATPSMMALSNLLAHPTIGPERMQSGGPMQGKLRSAKDLGRVLALAWLTEPDQLEDWAAVWEKGLLECFPNTHAMLRGRIGDGLRRLIDDPNALQEAFHTTDIGLLNGKRVDEIKLRATALRLLQGVVEPLARRT